MLLGAYKLLHVIQSDGSIMSFLLDKSKLQLVEFM